MLAPLATAQIGREFSRDIQDLAPGLRLWQLQYTRETYVQQIRVFEIDLKSSAIVLRAALGDDVWSGQPISTVRERESALVAWQALAQPVQGPSLSWPGLAVVNSSLVAAPGRGPVLAITPDGFVDLLDSFDDTPLGTLDSPGADPITPDSLNRTPTTDSLVLLFNPGVVRNSILAGQEVLSAAPIHFVPQAALRYAPVGQSAFSPWVASVDAQFSWNSEPTFSPLDRGQFAPKWSGVIATGSKGADLERTLSTRREGKLRLTTTPAWQDYESIVPLRKWLIRKDRIVVEPDPPRANLSTLRRARAAVGINPSLQRLWLAMVFDRARDAQGMTEFELAELMHALGATEAASGPEGTAVAADIHDRPILPPQRIPDRCRMALVVVPQERVPTAPWIAFNQRTLITATSTPPVDWSHSADRVLDRRQGIVPSLDHFWAARPRGGRPPALDLDLGANQIVGQIDLVLPQNAGFSSDLNPREIVFSFRSQGEDDWTVSQRVVIEEPRDRCHVLLDPPVAARFLRLEFTQLSFLPEHDTARLVEVVIWGRSAR